MNLKTFLLSAMILMFTCSCSGTYHAYYQTLQIALSEPEDAQVTLIKVQQSEIDIISVKRGERPSAIMALAYLENEQHKWVSGDNAMLIMEKGRIIRTLGLRENLLYLSNTELDPLKSLPLTFNSEPKGLTWSRMADKTGDEYGYPISSVFNQTSPDKLKVLGLNIETTLYIETLTYEVPANYLQLNKSWKNYFWYEKSGKMIKSIQKTSPLSESLEITYLSRIARLNQ